MFRFTWDNRRQELLPQKTASRKQTAYDAFIADPSEANEHRLVTLADPAYSEKQYALLRRAFEDLRGRVGTQAGKIIKPVVARIMEALSAEYIRYIGESPLYAKAGWIGKSLGLEWGGDWVGIEDQPHFQLKLGLTLADCRQRVALGNPVV